jgi:cell division protein FtsL
MRFREDVENESVSASFRKISPYIIVFTLCAFGLFMGLGVLRLYSFRLECKLNSVNRQIESYKANRIVLKHELSSLVSPARIYGFSKKEMGMTYASNVRILRVEEHLLADVSSETSPAFASRQENEGWLYFFLEGAMAGE